MAVHKPHLLCLASYRRNMCIIPLNEGLYLKLVTLFNSKIRGQQATVSLIDICLFGGDRQQATDSFVSVLLRSNKVSCSSYTACCSFMAKEYLRCLTVMIAHSIYLASDTWGSN